MQHKGTLELETSRLRLRRFTLDDAPAMYQNWASNPEVTKYLTWPTHDDISVTKSILEDWISKYNEPNWYMWGIVLKATNELIGNISIVEQQEQIQEVSVGYCIGSNWWNQGITTEALQSLIGFFFTEVGCNRVVARHDIHNPASGYVMKKCGMKSEGIMRKSDRNNQGICDMCCYAILKEDNN